ncbi:MAG: mechanosensitive ion channel [Bacteroidales bacterium]|nr:mechanosensitive ion channel [Bacteroidales bacterium]
MNQVDMNTVLDWIVKYGGMLLLAILFLIMGLAVIKWITRRFERTLKKREIDPSLLPFLKGLVNIGLKVLLIISVMTMVGIKMTSFIAILGAAGLALGLALSGTLQNFAGGVLILIIKPFRVGDYIAAQGHSGTVHEIQIFNTVLKTPDNRTIIIPNGGLSTSSVVNYSMEETRRMDFIFGIAYQDDVDKAKQILQDILDNEERFMKEPEPMIAVSELGDSSVNLLMRAWVNAADYWPLNFEIWERVKKAFDAQGISIPFPQHDVHLFQEK